VIIKFQSPKHVKQLASGQNSTLAVDSGLSCLQIVGVSTTKGFLSLIAPSELSTTVIPILSALGAVTVVKP